MIGIRHDALFDTCSAARFGGESYRGMKPLTAGPRGIGTANPLVRVRLQPAS